jgi:hypothetical protein
VSPVGVLSGSEGIIDTGITEVVDMDIGGIPEENFMGTHRTIKTRALFTIDMICVITIIRNIIEPAITPEAMLENITEGMKRIAIIQADGRFRA